MRLLSSPSENRRNEENFWFFDFGSNKKRTNFSYLRFFHIITILMIFFSGCVLTHPVNVFVCHNNRTWDSFVKRDIAENGPYQRST